MVLRMSYPKVPGQKTRLTYYVDEALKEAGCRVETTKNPGAVHVVFDERVNLLTGNGPQAIGAQAAKLRESARPKPRYPVGYVAKPLLALNRLLPDRVFDRIATSQSSRT